MSQRRPVDMELVDDVVQGVLTHLEDTYGSAQNVGADDLLAIAIAIMTLAIRHATNYMCAPEQDPYEFERLFKHQLLQRMPELVQSSQDRYQRMLTDEGTVN